MANTGLKKFANRQLFNSRTGQFIPNTKEENTEFLSDGVTPDPNYIEPVIDTVACPLPTTTTTTSTTSSPTTTTTTTSTTSSPTTTTTTSTTSSPTTTTTTSTTSSPTTTTTTSTTVSPCTLFQLTGSTLSGETLEVEYTRCDGLEVTETITNSGTKSVCVQTGTMTVISQGQGTSADEVGACT